MSSTSQNRLNTIEIVWIRHGHSCGNAKEFSERGLFHKLLKLQSLNPSLSNLGLLQIQQAKTAYHDVRPKKSRGRTSKKVLNDFLQQKVDFVFCSDMLRAMETAYNLFPKKDIHVLPYVNESSKAKLFIKLNLDVENRSQGPIDSVRRLKHLGYDPSHYNYEEYVDLTNGRIPFPNMHRFMEEVVMNHWFNRQSEFTLFPKGERRKKICVAIISHGHFLRNLVRDATRTPSTFWNSKPYFKSVHCQDLDYQSGEPAFGNVAMFTLRLTLPEVRKFLKSGTRLPAVKKLYETDASYDPKTKTCMEYDQKRSILPQYGRKSHVLRCPAHVRNISTLKK